MKLTAFQFFPRAPKIYAAGSLLARHTTAQVKSQMNKSYKVYEMNDTLYYISAGDKLGPYINKPLSPAPGGYVVKMNLNYNLTHISQIKVGDIIAESQCPSDGPYYFDITKFYKVEKVNAKSLIVERCYHHGRVATLSELLELDINTSKTKLTSDAYCVLKQSS